MKKVNIEISDYRAGFFEGVAVGLVALAFGIQSGVRIVGFLDSGVSRYVEIITLNKYV